MGDLAIGVKQLSKRYRIGELQRYKALRDTLTDALYAPFRAVASAWNGRRAADARQPSSEYFWALKDVSFEVKRGEVVGVIGRNGAGKSTLLRILSRITEPTEGYAEVRGRIGSLLEVGTGFHPELTGRENIYLNGAILGMRKAEIDRKLDEIVAFAGVEKFIDTPVKHYSSGMYVRLAFSVAAYLEPEILLVDEVLAVGDAAFQKKCLGKMGEVTREGRAVLFVSHNMGAISQLCGSVVVLDAGTIAFKGDVAEGVTRYVEKIFSRTALHCLLPDDDRVPLRILEVYATDATNTQRGRFDIGESFSIVVRYRSRKPLIGTNLHLLVNRNGVPVLTSFDTDSRPELLERRPAGDYCCRVEIPPHLLKEGVYTVTVGSGFTGKAAIDNHPDVIAFEIEAISEDTTLRGYAACHPGNLALPLVWSE